jgi:hypothetical protein
MKFARPKSSPVLVTAIALVFTPALSTRVQASNHPTSAKAHWAQAEIYAKAGKRDLARSEVLDTERPNPGLADFSARAVRELKVQLGLPTTDAKPPEGNPVGKHLLETRIPLAKMGVGLVAPVEGKASSNDSNPGRSTTQLKN